MFCFKSILQIWIILIGFRDTNDFVNPGTCKYEFKFTCRGCFRFTLSYIYIEGKREQNKREARLPYYGALFSETEKCYCFPCLSVEYHHLMFSTSYFKSSLSTISIKRVNAMPLWDFFAVQF